MRIVDELKDLYLKHLKDGVLDGDELNVLNRAIISLGRIGSSRNVFSTALGKKIEQKQGIFSRFFLAPQNTGYSLSDLAAYMSAFLFDINTIHLEVTGEGSDFIHNITNDLKYQSFAWIDNLSEMAISHEEKLCPIYAVPDNWERIAYPVPDTSVSAMKQILLQKLKTIFDILEDVSKSYDSGVTSKIDEMKTILDESIYKVGQFNK